MCRFASGRRAVACAAVIAVLSTACEFPDLLSTASDPAGDTSPAEQVLSGNAERPPLAEEIDDLEPNNDFSSAQLASFDQSLRIVGSIAGAVTPTDADVFDLGPVSPGDRILATLTVSTGSDVVLGLLDQNQHLLGYIDQTSISAGPTEADLVIRQASSRLYVVLGTRSLSSTARTYAANISIERGAGAASTSPQVLVLNFSGADRVRIGQRTPVDVPPFDAGYIGDAYADQTEIIIAAILEKVRADFAGLNVAVYRDTDPALPPGDHSTVYFGTYDSRLLGLADDVDPYNADPVESAILYTDTFSIFNVLSPTVEQLAQTLANTTSHEAGHLLGLRHTADPTDLMDTTASARQMMIDQDFSLAELNASVLPLGWQDAPVMLAWSVGGELILPPVGKSAARMRTAQAAGASDDFYIPRQWLMSCTCGGCAVDPR